MNRRSLIFLLVGVISALAGGAVATFVERRRCVGAGGLWDAGARHCQLATGVPTGMSPAALAIGAVAAIFIAVFLYRAFLFFARQGIPRSS